MTQRLSNLQLLRAIAVIAVVLFHSIGFSSIDGGIFTPIYQLGAAGVDLFFVISGFIIWHISNNTQLNAINFLKRRYLRIMPMYWLVSLGLIAILILSSEQLTTDKIITSLLLLPSTTPPILNVGWSLVHELYFYCVFALLLPIRSLLLKLVLLWAWAISTSIYHFYTIPLHPWLSVLTHPFNIEFTLGATLAYLFTAATQLTYRYWLYAVLALIISLGSWTQIFGWYFPESIERVIYFALPIALIVLAAVNSPPQHNLFSHILERVGDASYSIYLTHVPVLAAISLLAGLVGFSINSLAALIICLVVGQLSFRHLEQPLLQFVQQRPQRLATVIAR